MPAVIKKYPVYITDEPITYGSFVGGINTDPSNEHLMLNELRDALNMHYQSGALVKRQGAKLISSLYADEDLINIQATFLFTYKLTYIIVAADGKLYYGIYNKNTKIKVTRLPILFNYSKRTYIHDPENMEDGLPKYFSNAVPINLTHDGYVISDWDTSKYIGDIYELEDKTKLTDGSFVMKNNLYYKFNNKDTLDFTFISPLDTNYWEKLGSRPSIKTIHQWSKRMDYYIKDIVIQYTDNNYYKCIKDHNIFPINPEDDTNKYFLPYDVFDQLIFQNYKRIEASTFNNELYIATGTRFIKVYIKNNILKAEVIKPRLLNKSEYNTIGFNYFSPYPELAIETKYDQAITSINSIQVLKEQIPSFNEEFKIYAKHYILKPIMNFAAGESEEKYYFKWEKLINNEWIVVIPFTRSIENSTALEHIKINYDTLRVIDADKYQYRVTFANSFESEDNPETTEVETVYTLDKNNDRIVNKVDGSYWGQAVSILYNNNLTVEETFLKINSCVKITGDGNKFILYSDSFNSGEWFKTVLAKPDYITQRGGLSFKTNKNEAVIKVIPFFGSLIVFANSENIGGSIHLVSGNGDDYEADTYYSPYRRKTINNSISCDNAETVQVCENLLMFKYFDTIYFIQASELDNEKISVYSANDRIKLESKDVKIPWDDNSCISEITEDFYSILWKEKYIIEDNELVLVHPAIRVKMYYKTYQQINNKAYFPWLRDESKVFNVDHIFYVKGKPIYLYNNSLISFDEKVYTDLGEIYECLIHLRAYDLEKPKMFKLLDNITVFFHRNQNSSIEFDTTVLNEAGHKLLTTSLKSNSVQDLRNLKLGNIFNNDIIKLDSTIADSKVVNSSYKFPFLLADTIVSAKNDKEFSFASITFNYLTVDVPDTNPYDLYKSILRKEE